MTKKKIFFIGTGDIDESACIKEDNLALAVVNRLRQDYEVSTSYHLVHFENAILQCLKSREYDALITHVPLDPSAFEERMQLPSLRTHIFKRLYNESLRIIARIRDKNPKLPIIAYTGSDMDSLLSDTEYVRQIIRKTGDVDTDTRTIKKALEEVLNANPCSSG